MSSWGGFWYSKKEEVKPLHVKVFEDFTQRTTTAFQGAIPGIEKRISEAVELHSKEINDHITEENVTKLMDYVCDDISKIFSNLLQGNTSEAMKRLGEIREDGHQKAKMVSNYEKDVKELEKNAEEGKEVELDLKTKHHIIKTYVRYFSKHQKKLKIVVFGSTQVGKSTLIRFILNLKKGEIEIKGTNLESDTKEVTEYQIIKNEITITLVDTPGISDSRGEDQDSQNFDKILNYLAKTKDIDCIFWVAKLADIIDLSVQNKIAQYTKKYGPDIWKKCIVILTHANCTPIPESYFLNEEESDDDSDDVDKDQIEYLAWIKFTNAKKFMWKNMFRGITDVDVPVCFSENSKRYETKINGVKVLKDHTPILETIEIEMFNTIQKDKSAITFLVLADNESQEHKTALNNASNKAAASINNSPGSSPAAKFLYWILSGILFVPRKIGNIFTKKT